MRHPYLTSILLILLFSKDSLDASESNGYNVNETVKDCNEMFQIVKRMILGLLLLGISIGTVAEATEQRTIYLEPHLPVEYYMFCYQALSKHPIWQIQLNQGERQILRVDDLSLLEDKPFYWAQTRLDERKVIIRARITLEIWEGAELKWMRSTELERPYRLLGPELRGTGLSILAPQQELPTALLTPLPQKQNKLTLLQHEVIQALAHEILKDYQQHS